MKKIDARTSQPPDTGHVERDQAASTRFDAGHVDESAARKIAPARGIVIGIVLAAILWVGIAYLLF